VERGGTRPLQVGPDVSSHAVEGVAPPPSALREGFLEMPLFEGIARKDPVKGGWAPSHLFK